MKPWLSWFGGGGEAQQQTSAVMHVPQTRRSKIASCGDRLCHNQLVYFW